MVETRNLKLFNGRGDALLLIVCGLFAFSCCGCGERGTVPRTKAGSQSNATTNQDVAKTQKDTAGQATSSTDELSAVGISAPPGFRVTRYAGDDLAHDITSMTIDSHGRVVVSGPWYVKILHDDDGNGSADRATNFCEYPGRGAHGMLFLGNDLLCNGDHGLRLLRDADGDDRWDGRATREEWMTVNHTEHGAGGIVQGPDGWVYMICGNDAGVGPEHATSERSLIREPVAGTLLRISPDGSQTQIIAHGFRNPYDIDFTAANNIITVDSDGERDQYLPWYSPTRMFDIALGQEHGWVLRGWQRSWNRPESFFDNVERLAELGRGSPTGVVAYRHTKFPARYRDGIFSACWTLGRVYYVPLHPDGATYSTAEPEIFLQTTGSVGFAPVDLAIGPQGDLFVAIGGRGTQGGVFRVTYVGKSTDESLTSADNSASPTDPLLQVLDAPQPLTSWSRAKWLPLARELGAEAFANVAKDEAADIAHRLRAMEILTEVFGGIDDLVADVTRSSFSPEVRAHAAWALGRMDSESTFSNNRTLPQLLEELTRDDSPLVARRAWESLLLGDPELAVPFLKSSYLEAANSPSRRVRDAIIAYVRYSGNKTTALSWLSKAAAGGSPGPRMAMLRMTSCDGDIAPQTHFPGALDLLAETDSAELKLNALRLMQIGLGDVLLAGNDIPSADGYVAASPDGISADLRNAAAATLQASFPSGEDEVDRELARTIAMLGVPATSFADQAAIKWTEESEVTDDLHYLMVVARLLESSDEAPLISQETTQSVAGAFVRLHAKLASRNQFPSQNWPQRVGELAGIIMRHMPDLASEIVQRQEFGRVEHSLFVAQMSGAARLAGIRKLLETTLSEDPRFGVGYESWTPEFVTLLKELPTDEAAPHLESAWAEFALRDAVLPLLARSPAIEHRAKYIEALDSMQPRTVELALDALLQLVAARDSAVDGRQSLNASVDDMAAVLSALRQACLAPNQRRLRLKFVELLQSWAGQDFGIVEEAAENPAKDADVNVETSRLLALYDPCFAWFATEHPEAAAKSGSLFGGADWSERLAIVDWSSGDVERGEQFYQRKTCARCHDGAGGLGPELRGAAGRFSREDLFASIVDPNRDVAPLYQTTLIETEDGQIYAGLIVYESPEGTLVQVSPNEVVRISDSEIRTRQRSRRSLMPQGLLDDATDQDLADLDAYLSSLSQNEPEPE